MTKSVMTRGKITPINDIDYSQKILTRKEFGKRLSNFIGEKDWNQSDLAKASGMGRDSISHYVRGRSVPTPRNLKKLAAALGVETEVLFPNYDAQSNAFEEPTFEMKSIDAEADKVWLRINMKVSTERALEVGRILRS